MYFDTKHADALERHLSLALSARPICLLKALAVLSPLAPLIRKFGSQFRLVINQLHPSSIVKDFKFADYHRMTVKPEVSPQCLPRSCAKERLRNNPQTGAKAQQFELQKCIAKILDITDIDFAVYEVATGFVLLIQHKWLVPPETVEESSANDERLAIGIRQAIDSRKYVILSRS